MAHQKKIALAEMILLVSMSFAFSVMWSESVSAFWPPEAGPPPPITGAGATGTIALPEGSLVRSPSGALSVVKDNALTNPASGLAEGSKFTYAGQDLVVKGGQAVPASEAAAGSGSATGINGILSGSTFGTTGAAGIASSLVSGLAWGAIVGGVAWGLASLFGLEDDQAMSVGLAAGGGTFAGTTAYFMASHYATAQIAAGTPSAFFTTLTPGMFGILTGAGVGVAILLLTYKETKQELVRFECLPWEPPRGGSMCEQCDDDPNMPCSEYRCKSLGQGCELINPGTTEESCVWVHKGDTAAPHIEPDAGALLPNGLRYVPDTAISPPNRGFKIVDSVGDECLPAFTSLQFGIIADEPAQCKIDLEPRAKYDEMAFLFGSNNLFLEKHTQNVKVPSPFTQSENETEGPEILNDGTTTLWVRCIDANGNGEDSALVAFRYCVDQGPDTTPPQIVGTSIRSDSAVQFDADSVPIEVYVNEPAECKWSRQDKDFDFMENTMSCASQTHQINADLNYVCSAGLTGIENRADNWFYFRCRDHSTAPGGRNTMTTSHPLVLRGTEPLVITKVGPTGEFRGSASVATVTLTAETNAGADSGSATCYFDTEADGRFDIAMENTNSFTHNQSLDLTAGNYTIYFRCIDSGGNRAEANTNFVVAIDDTLPSVTRVFRDGNVLKVITDEEARCYYGENSCTYALADGLPMTYSNPTVKTVHTTPWKEDTTFYIKCEDLQGNQPRPDFCQIIAEASEL